MSWRETIAREIEMMGLGSLTPTGKLVLEPKAKTTEERVRSRFTQIETPRESYEVISVKKTEETLKVLGSLKVATRNEIHDALMSKNVYPANLSACISDLVSKGYVHRARRGTYEITEEGIIELKRRGQY
jgi:hypothetical protein